MVGCCGLQQPLRIVLVRTCRSAAPRAIRARRLAAGREIVDVVGFFVAGV